MKVYYYWCSSASSNISFQLSTDFTSNEYNINNLILNIGDSNNVAIIYKITWKNINYDITFDDFLINDIIDLSIDPSQWGNSEGSDYDFYDYDLFDYDTI